jgi:hypothetical protein
MLLYNKKMLLEEITNRKQIEAVARHNLDVSVFNSKEELSKHLLAISKKKYYDGHKEMFQVYYKENKTVILEKNKTRRESKKQSKNNQVISEPSSPPAQAPPSAVIASGSGSAVIVPPV